MKGHKKKPAEGERGAWGDKESEAFVVAPAPEPPTAVAQAAAPGASDLLAPIHIHPHADGLFQSTQGSVDPDSIELDETYRARQRSKIALWVTAAVAVVIVGAAIWVANDPPRSHDVQCFLAGTLEHCKTAAVKKLEAKWSSEDMRARNRYGDITLTYFPEDAQVKVTQIKYHESGSDWTKHLDTKTQVGEKDIPNKTSNLKEGQTIERLPIQNLPIFETHKAADGSVSDVLYYEYKLAFTDEGYNPHDVTIRPEDWQRVGPGNFRYPWKGLDLVPKPETIKANFAKVMGDFYCYMKLHKKVRTIDKIPEDNRDRILNLNGFKTKDDFEKAYAVLTSGDYVGWWSQQQTDITKKKCKDQ